jgi:hypothetical protein
LNTRSSSKSCKRRGQESGEESPAAKNGDVKRKRIKPSQVSTNPMVLFEKVLFHCFNRFKTPKGNRVVSDNRARKIAKSYYGVKLGKAVARRNQRWKDEFDQ